MYYYYMKYNLKYIFYVSISDIGIGGRGYNIQDDYVHHTNNVRMDLVGFTDSQIYHQEETNYDDKSGTCFYIYFRVWIFGIICFWNIKKHIGVSRTAID